MKASTSSRITWIMNHIAQPTVLSIRKRGPKMKLELVVEFESPILSMYVQWMLDWPKPMVFPW